MRDSEVSLRLGPLADKPRRPALSPEARVAHGMGRAVESAQMYEEGRLDALEFRLRCRPLNHSDTYVVGIKFTTALAGLRPSK